MGQKRGTDRHTESVRIIPHCYGQSQTKYWITERTIDINSNHLESNELNKHESCELKIQRGHSEHTGSTPLTRSLKYRRLLFSFRGSLAVHDPPHYSCSELALGIKFTSTSHADLGHNLPHDQGYN